MVEAQVRRQTRIGTTFASEVTLESFLPSVSNINKMGAEPRPICLVCAWAQPLEPSPGVSYGNNHHIINIKTRTVWGIKGGPT